MSSDNGAAATDQRRLERLIRAKHPCIAISTFEEAEVLETVRKAGIELGLDPWVWTHAKGVHHGLLRTEEETIKESEHPAAALYYLQNKPGKFIGVLVDVRDHLEREPKILRMLRETIDAFYERGNTLVLVDHRDDWPPVVAAHATRFEPSLPDGEELEGIIKQTLQRLHREKPVKVTLTREELATIIKNLRGLTRRQAEQIIEGAVAEDREFNGEDINHILAAKRRAIGQNGLLQYVETPTSLEEVGGLRRLKRWLAMRQPSQQAKVEAFGLKPARGVMMLGVQGAGKSMCAKAIATAWQWPLLQMDPGALYDRYIGESERRLREALHQAEAMAPIVLWIDEIEKGFASAAGQSNDGGTSRRMFGSLLTWMQEHEAPVFLVATANDIESLPPELLRKGRFDEIFFVDLPDAEVREQIFRIHLRKRNRDPEAFDLEALTQASEGYSGAEIEQAVLASLYEAFGKGRELTSEEVVKALEESPPLSVTMREKVQGLRRWAEDRCVPAD